MPQRKARLRAKQKKMMLRSPVISTDDIITCTALVGDWTITATCERSESEQCMRELKDLPSCVKECTVSHDLLIDVATLREAERLIQSCEGCNPDGAEIPFDNILDRVTGSDPSVTDYVLEQPAKCPNCRREILEKTLVEPASDH